MDAKVKGQGHKVTHDENAQSAENLINATVSLQMTRYSLNNSSMLSSNTTISQDMSNPCPWTFRPRIRLMNLPR